MSGRKEITTTKEQIADYWTKHEDECGLSVDFAEAHERCWRCRRGLERCHLDNPNVTDPEIMWDWFCAHGAAVHLKRQQACIKAMSALCLLLSGCKSVPGRAIIKVLRGCVKQREKEKYIYA